MSTKPGATTRPFASIVWRASSGAAPSATTMPPLTPTSPATRGLPEPSIMLPPVILRSYAMSALASSVGKVRADFGEGEPYYGGGSHPISSSLRPSTRSSGAGTQGERRAGGLGFRFRGNDQTYLSGITRGLPSCALNSSSD